MAQRIAVRCDGGAEGGAGHVARCLPIALELRRIGASISIVGRLDGLAAWMVRSAGITKVESPTDFSCGIDPARFDAALVDLYDVAQDEVCALARALPSATLAEAVWCPEAGVLVDYHLDRDVSEDGPRLLAGPTYAPVDPEFISARRERGDVRRVLVTLGGSTVVRRQAKELIAVVADVYPSATLLVAGGLPTPDRCVVEFLPDPGGLVEAARDADLAVTASGMTAYELACAGVPFVALVVADNQARVGAGIERKRIALVLDIRAGLDADALRDRLARLSDSSVRRSLAAAGPRLIDGRGASRVAAALAVRWGLGR